MTYDFVIIGSGPAGTTCFMEITESGFKIALIDRATQEKKFD